MAMSSATRDKAAAVQQSFTKRADAIRGRGELTPDAKLGMLAQAHADAQTAMQELRQRAAEDAAAGSRTATQKAFGVSNVSGDPAMLAVSMRDAMDRLATVTNSRDAAALLNRADSVGDEVLARAVANHAFTQATNAFGRLDPGWSEIVNNFAANRPSAATAIEGLVSQSSPDAGWEFFIPTPTELDGVPSGRREVLANSAP